MIILENVSKVFRIPHERTKTLYHKLLSITNKGYTYENLYALKNINLHVDLGEFIGIIGRNGSGKSTLLRIIAGVYKPTSGKVKVNDEISPLLELGLGFDSSFSCRDNIYVYGSLLGFSRRYMEGKVDEILSFAELERFADAKLETLSTGMRSRLAFAIAIQSVAPIILADEVLAVGDKIFAQKCHDIFRKFQEEGRTIVLVTHDIGAVNKFCNRVLVINEGEIVGDGKPEDMVEFYNKNVLNAIGKVEHYNSYKFGNKSQNEIIIDIKKEKENFKVDSSIKIEITKEQPAKNKTYGYDPKDFWEKRLTQNFNLKGVGNLSFSEHYNGYLYQQRLAVLKKVIKKYNIQLSNKNVLDVGCGTGYFVKYYLEHGANVTGIDIAQVAIEKLRKTFSNAEFLLADISNLNNTLNEGFDIINIFNTTFHLVNDNSFNDAMISCCGRLKKGGYLFVTDLFPNEDFSPAPHVKFRSIENYKLLQDYNIDILEIMPIHHLMNKKLKYLSIDITESLASILFVIDKIINILHLSKGNDIKLLVARRKR